MENPHISQETKFLAKIAAVSVGVIALAHSCLPEDRTPTDEQRQDPAFIECVEYRLEHDDFTRTPGPQGMYVGPTNEQVAEDRCLHDLFPTN